MSLSVVIVAAVIIAASPSKVMTKNSDGTYIVNTTTLGAEIKGYKGATPLLVYIKKDKVVKIEALPNNETPRFFNKLKNDFIHSWDGLSTSKAVSLDVDARTGATYSAKSVKENVKRALEYYKKHK